MCVYIYIYMYIYIHISTLEDHCKLYRLYIYTRKLGPPKAGHNNLRNSYQPICKCLFLAHAIASCVVFRTSYRMIGSKCRFLFLFT